MLIDSRGHLKLTDLGLCKKVGEVSPTDEPEMVLEMLRNQTLEDNDVLGAGDVRPGEGSAGNRHRTSDDPMAMSIEGGTSDGAKGPNRDAKKRREVRTFIYCFSGLRRMQIAQQIFS